MSALKPIRVRGRWHCLWLVPFVAVALAAVALWPEPAVQHAAPATVFSDGEGRRVVLGDFKGKVVLVNFWATWCAPCREEMPALDRLQEKLGGPDFQVVALAVDRGGASAIRRFYEQVGVKQLPIYVDTSGASLREAAAPGLPTTILLDRGGREVARFVGQAEWDGPKMTGVIKSAITAEKGSSS